MNDRSFFIGVGVGLVLAYALYLIFKGKMDDSKKGYVVIITGLGLYFLLYNFLGCRHGRYH